MTNHEELRRLATAAKEDHGLAWYSRREADFQIATTPDVVLALLADLDALRTLITKFHAAKGRYHTQLAACDLFDAAGLKNERPVK